jgi:hypothetical protein
MSNSVSVGNVISGVEYAVQSVNGHAPRSLDDFVEQPTVLVVASMGEHAVTFQGSARPQHECVIVYEKDHDGTGKDIRTWLICEHDGGFHATERSMF